MTPTHSDDIFRQLAGRYVELDGHALHRELDTLTREPDRPTPRIDETVHKLLPRRTRWHVLGLIAACVALIILVPWLMSRAPTTPSPSGTGSHTSGTSGDSEPDIIPLSFTLPGTMRVEAVELDRSKSVYTLHDDYADNVVMTLEYRNDALDTAGMDTLTIDRQTVYVRVEDGYNLITFQKDGITYELTCKYDVNTLLYLGSYIL